MPRYIDSKPTGRFGTNPLYFSIDCANDYGEFSLFFASNFDPQGPTIYEIKGNFKGISGSLSNLV